MGRIPTYPTTYDDCRKITVTDLKKWGYLKSSKTGTVRWRRHGEVTSSIGLESYVSANGPEWIRLYYSRSNQWTGEKQSYNYKVYFDFIPSNLGVGKRPYLRCPVTGKRALVLYSLPGFGKYAHRSAQDLYYEKEIQSKYYRHLETTYGPMFEMERIFPEFHSPGKYRKTRYRGKETRWYRELRERVEGLEEKQQKALRMAQDTRYGLLL